MTKEELEKIKALYDFLIENHMNLESCSCCDAISIYWEDKEIACGIESISDLKNLISSVEEKL